MASTQRRVAVTARGDRAGDDTLAFDIAGDGGAELFDDPDRFMPDREPLHDRIFALEDVDVGPADGGRGNPHQGIGWPHVGHRLVLQNDAAGLDENGRLHLRSRGHDAESDATSNEDTATTTCAGAKGLVIIRLLGTPRALHSCPRAPLM